MGVQSPRRGSAAGSRSDRTPAHQSRTPAGVAERRASASGRACRRLPVSRAAMASERWPISSATAGRGAHGSPFHPLRGQPVRFMATGPLWGEERVTFEHPDGGPRSVPVQWTDLGPTDPYLSVGRGQVVRVNARPPPRRRTPAGTSGAPPRSDDIGSRSDRRTRRRPTYRRRPACRSRSPRGYGRSPSTAWTVRSSPSRR
jgi:Family of unknown function (DUF5372)